MQDGWNNRNQILPTDSNNKKGIKAVKDTDPQEMRKKWAKPYNCPHLLPWESFQVTNQGESLQEELGRRHQLKR